MRQWQIGNMKYIKNNEINNLIDKYPFFYYPYILKLNNSSNDDYHKILNSVALRHPKRFFLKEFLKINNFDQKTFIDDLIMKNPKISKRKINDSKNEDLSLKSINQKKIITENMAKIYEKQKKIKEAIKIYEKLISLNSKKKSYFAKKIEKLKS